MFKPIIKCLASVFLGFLLVLFFIKDDAVFKRIASNKLQTYFSSLFDSSVSLSIKRITFFPASLQLESVLVKPHKSVDWSWSCSDLSLSFSWFDFLLYGTISLAVIADKFQADTFLSENGLNVWNHMLKVCEGEAQIAIFLQSLKILQGQLIIKEPYIDSVITTQFELDGITIDNAFKSVIRFLNGGISIRNTKLFERLQGTVRYDVLYKAQGPHFMISPKLNIDLPQMGDRKTVHITGAWKVDQGVLTAKNSDRSFVIAPIKLYTIGKTMCVELQTQFPASYLYALLSDSVLTKDIAGQCRLRTSIEFNGIPSLMRNVLQVGPITYKQKEVISGFTVTCKRDHEHWNGNVFFALDKKQTIQGGFFWDEQKNNGTINFCNQTILNIPFFKYWCVQPKNFSTNMQYKPDDTVSGSYRWVAGNTKTDARTECIGLLEWKHGQLKTEMKLEDYDITFACNTTPPFCIQHLLCTTDDRKTVMDFRSHNQKEKRFIGAVSCSFFKKLLQMYGYELQGQGLLKLFSTVKNNKIVTELKLCEGTLRVPYLYNFLHDASVRCTIDPYKKTVALHEGTCLFHRGIIRCFSGKIAFDDQYNLLSALIPLRLSDCFVNWKKDLFAVVSGDLVYKKDENDFSNLSGMVTIDRSQLKRNIFSQDFRKSFLGSVIESDKGDYAFDLHVKTKDPVRVKTSFLQTAAHIDCSLKGTMQSPLFSGSITMNSGTLAFPYKPLHIINSTIRFSSEKVDDPIIEIHARNKIKKYTVDLDLFGSGQQPQIRFTATPDLRQEQIVSLLFAGSEKESLNILMPALIMQNIKGILFDSYQLPTGIKKSFRRFFKPLEHIHLVPSFADQTGRGGLRASIEIEATERWRALLQKNFSLTEDTKVEVEYLLSDDISLRGVRNEQGDVSAEVEMRWKF